MTRRILFQLHWFFGITAGVVLAVQGITGATMGFEEEIIAALSHDRMVVEARSSERLTPDALREQIKAQAPDSNIDRLTLRSEPDQAASVRLSPQGEGGHRRLIHLDPYTGQFLGEARGTAFFAFVRELHRWLALPKGPNGIGRTITGFCLLTLLFFIGSGLYLRWPREPLNWRAWLALDVRKTGRNLYRNLHVIIGTWVVPVYLVIALTGLWWSYDGYRATATRVLTGEWPAQRGGREGGGGQGRGERPAPKAEPSWNSAWNGFTGLVGSGYGEASLSSANGGALRIDHLPADARFSRMTDQYQFEVRSGALRNVERYADKPLGKTIAGNMLPIHSGRFFGLPGQITMSVASLAMPLFLVTGVLLYLHRRRRAADLSKQTLSAQSLETFDGDGVLVAYASQTGGAARLAHAAAQAFLSGGQTASVLPLARVDASVLSQAKRALFIVSTYGDGEPPDTARRFERLTMQNEPVATHLQYGVLALGDREYPQFCAFGHRVDRWLQSGGAQSLFKTIEVDGEQADALTHWHERLAELGAGHAVIEVPQAYGRWRLIDRRCLNEGGLGLPTYHLSFEPIDGIFDWAAGDIAELIPQALRPNSDTSAKLPAREYSIASLPTDGRLELIVRQVRRDDGELGIGSGWITAGLPLRGEIDLRVRSNPGFRLPVSSARPLVLIGNGTGLAGLRAHLRAQAAAGHGGHWLLFGERNRAHDAYFDDELQHWLQSGILARLDRAFSRDADCGRYVQELLHNAAEEVRRHADNGAAFIVCGSLAGMAGAVDAELRAALGDERVDQLVEQGLYLRDVY